MILWYLRVVCVLILMMGVSSCGYRMTHESSFGQCTTLSVPYVKGDLDGRLTTAIIKKLSESSKWHYAQEQGDCVLDIEVVRHDNSQIGYQYDRVKSTAELIDRLIPNEGRRTVRVRLNILDAAREQVLHGPYEIEASADYDFVNFDTYKDLAFVNEEGIAQSVLTYSLGQLDSEEGGMEAVLAAVYQTLAEKILIGLDHL